MAKALQKAKAQSKAVATVGAAGIPAAIMKAGARGRGVSTRQEDNLVPMIYILQAQSPQVNKRSPDYLAGAEGGDIWLRNAPDPIVKGEQGLLFQPCHFYVDWVEWIPRDSGGGFVGRHDRLPDDVKVVEDPQNPNRRQFIRKNGNEVKETRYHVGYVKTDAGNLLPYVIPLTSSGHTVSRQWMFMMNSKMVPGVGKADSWSCWYRLKTKERSNSLGTWAALEVTDGGWVQTEEDLKRGEDLFNAFAAGAKAVEHPVADADQGGGDNAAM